MTKELMTQINQNVDDLLGERRKLELAISTGNQAQINHAKASFLDQLACLCNTTKSSTAIARHHLTQLVTVN